MYTTSSGFNKVPPDPDDQDSLVSVRPRLKPVNVGVSSQSNESVRVTLGSLGSRTEACQNLATVRPLLGSEHHESRLLASSCSSFEQEHQRFQQPSLMTENDSKIALLERELYLAKRLSELEKREQEVSRIFRNVDNKHDIKIKSDPLQGFGSIEVAGGDKFDMKEDMFRQIEKSRREEVARLTREKMYENIPNRTSDTEVTRQKVRQMLERKKKEVDLRHGIESSTSSSIQNFLPKSSDVTQEIFESDSGEDIDYDQLECTAYKQHGNDIFPQSHNTGYVEQSSLPLKEKVQEQLKIWDSIKREREEEEKRLHNMKNSKVVREQEEILRQINERNEAEKNEEALTFKLIAEMTLNDQQQQTEDPHFKPSSARSSRNPAVPLPMAAAAPAGVWGGGPKFKPSARSSKNTAVPQPMEVAAPAGAWGGGEWSVVGAKVKEKMASLKYAAELDLRMRQNSAQTQAMRDWRKEMLEKEEVERKRQVKQWEESQKIKTVKNGQIFHPVEDSRGGASFKEFLDVGRRQVSKDRATDKDGGISRGARRKSEGWQAAHGRESRRRISGNQKSTAEQQLEKAEEAAISREWEIATRKKDSGLSESRLYDEEGPNAKNNKYLKQKTRQR